MRFNPGACHELVKAAAIELPKAEGLWPGAGGSTKCWRDVDPIERAIGRRQAQQAAECRQQIAGGGPHAGNRRFWNPSRPLD